MELKKRILVAPLNWGLGHATRCIPIINALLEHNFEPVIASDGEALLILQKEFPQLESVTLPSYNIKYPKNAKQFTLKLIANSPKLAKVVQAERAQLKKLVQSHRIDGIISDNRLGIYSKKVPSVFITHQINVLSGATTWLSSKLHQCVIKKYNECWVPDVQEEPSLSGRLGHDINITIPIKYLGTISRFEKKKCTLRHDLLVLLSGPEPQRTLLETKLLDQLTAFDGRVLFVKGKITANQVKETTGHITSTNFMTSDELETAINESKYVLSRSGYTTILDLAKLGKKAFFK